MYEFKQELAELKSGANSAINLKSSQINIKTENNFESFKDNKNNFNNFKISKKKSKRKKLLKETVNKLSSKKNYELNV